jgi:surface antigen
MKNSRLRVRGIVSAALVGGSLLVAAPAGAMPPPCDVVGNPCPTGAKEANGTVDVAPGQTLGVRPRPKQDAKQIRQLKDGAKVVIVCQKLGDQVSGTFGTSKLWDKLKKGGFVSDAYVSTGSDGRVAPDCPRSSKPHPATHPTESGGGQPRSVVLKDDYPYANESPKTAEKWGFYHRECTSFVAYRLNRLKKFTFSNRMQGGHFGDAGNWDDNARALGFKVNNTPTVGSVMVRDSGTWGHVAIVAKVTKTRFLIEEYNHDVSHGYGQRWIARAPNADWSHFIHFRQ